MNLFQVTKKQPSGGLELKTFTGNPVTFTPTYSEALPAPFNSINLKAAIVAKGGNGTPSTPIPIVGHSELNLVRCGANIWNEEWKIKLSAGVEYIASKNPIPVLPNTTYYIKTPTSTSIDAIDENDTYISFIGNRTNATFTTPADCHFIRIATPTSLYGNVYNNDISINYPSTDTSYHAYNGTPYLVSFGQTVYGGEYDANRGKIRLTWGTDDLGTFDWNEVSQRFNTILQLPNAKAGNYIGCLCSIYETRDDVLSRVVPFSICIANNGYCYVYDTRFNDAASFKAGMNGIMVAYELATPIEIDVSELSVDTIVGVNNIVSDGGGDIEVKCLI